MEDLIEVGNIEVKEIPGWMKSIPMGKEVQEDEPKDHTSAPKSCRAESIVKANHHQRLLAVAIAAHFFLHALGKPLLHHGLIVEETRTCDALDSREHPWVKAQGDRRRFT